MAFPSKNASMIVAAAAFLACGGLTEQATQGTEPASSDPAPEPAADAVPVKVADDVGIPSAIAIGDERIVFTTKRTMLHGRLGDAGGLFIVHKRLGPALLVSMDPGDAHYDALAIDEAHAYVATSDARIFRVPLAGGPETPIAELRAAAVAIAVADAHVYFATGSGVLERVPKDGVGAIETLATLAGRPRALTVDDRGTAIVATSVVLGEGGSIVKVVPGGEPTLLGTSATSPCAMVRDGHNVFFTTSGAVHRLMVEGGPATTVTAGPFSACAIAADRESLWFSSGIGLMRAPTEGGEPVAITGATAALAAPGAVAVDDTHVYWLDGTAVLRVSKTMR